MNNLFRIQLPYDQKYLFRGAMMSYRKLGSGPPIVLLHGSVIYWPQIGEFEQRLAENYTVYLPDMPGFGASDAINGVRHNTDLFADVLCRFLEQTKLRNTPIVGWSLGTVITVKAAARGSAKGKLILVGMPGRVNGWLFDVVRHTPLAIQERLVTTRFGKEHLLVPILRHNIGVEQGRLEEFMELISHTAPRAIIDVDYKKEIEEDLPFSLKKMKNERMFMYGEHDKLRWTVSDLVVGPVVIPSGTHNVFRSNPKGTLRAINQFLQQD